MHHYRYHITILSVLLFFIGCKPEKEKIDLPEILERGELIAITGYSPLTYFIYHGQPMGYEYELLQMLGEHLNLKIDIILARDIETMIEMLKNGDGDLIAYNLTVTTGRRVQLAFTDPMNVTRQVLVQRKPEEWRQMQLHQIENKLIRNALDLAGRTVHVRKGSAYITRLENLATEIGGEIDIIEASGQYTTEDLIRLVAEGSIELTVADENIAKIQTSYYQNLDIETAVSLPQQTAWAVRHTSPALLSEINDWLEKVRTNADYYVIYNKYFENRRAFRARYGSDYFPITGGTISPFDDILREEAERIGWDWRMLAALVYQESQFRPQSRSWAGAVGLMQLMPRTSREFGASDPYDPEQNIRAGVSYLLWLDTYWQDYIEDDDERRNFVIASYNVGQGHVQDARRLAAEFDGNPDVWHDNVERFMLKKSNPDYYYNTELVRFGYASGIEPVTYVENIFNLFEHYKRFVD